MPRAPRPVPDPTGSGREVPRWWWSVAVGGSMLLVVAVSTRLAASGAPWRVVVTQAGYAIIVASGLIVWRHRPGGATGPLLCAWGLINIGLGAVASVEGPAALAFTYLGDPAIAAAFVHLVLSYPSGRLDRSGRVLATAVYSSLVLWLVPLILAGGHMDRCLAGCPGNVRFSAAVSAIEGLTVVQRTVTVALAAVFVVALVQRVRQMPRFERRAAAPVAVAAIGPITSFLAGEVLAMTQPAVAWWEAHWWLDRITIFWLPAAMAVVTVRRRLTRARVATVVAGLAGAAPGELGPLIATLLRDPSLEIFGLAGSPDGPPDVSDPRTRVRLGPGVTMLHDPGLTIDDPVLLAAGVAAARMVVANERLTAQVRDQLGEVGRSRARILRAGDRERRRLERDLHDGAQQSLLGVGIVLNLARQEAEDGSAAAVLMDEARDRLRDALADLRALARGLAPAMLTERGLAEALNDLVRRCPVAVDLHVDVAERPPSPVELAAYFVVAEALQNVARHAAARHAEVTVILDDADLHVEVSDDGKGGTNPADGTGLRGLTDRVAAIGGSLTLRSPLGAGTTVHARLPRRPVIDVTG